jgi:RecB family exonuclease
VITPRTTRLVRTADPAALRAALADLSCEGTLPDIRNRLVVVPTRAAAAHLLRSIEARRLGRDGVLALPEIATSGDLIARLGERLPVQTRHLTAAEREVLAGAACRKAIADGHAPPFQLRPGLVAAIVRFYDALHRHQRTIDVFERLALGLLEPGAADDRGAERLVRQTRFLVAAFRCFERLVADTGRTDDVLLRRALVGTPAADPWRHVVLAVGDAAFDRYGLAAVDWDLLSRLPGLARLDVVVTERLLAGACHERIHERLPGIEELKWEREEPRPFPALETAGGAAVRRSRDREEEIADFARWVRHLHRSTGGVRLDRIALVVRRPLPYVYLAREVLGSARVPCQMFDALPLASEPYAAALDLVVAFVTGQFGRVPAIALLRSPHFRWGGAQPLAAAEVAALDRALSEAGYLGDRAALERLVETWRSTPARAGARRAAAIAAGLAGELEPLRVPAPGRDHLDRLLRFLRRHERVPRADDVHGPRLLRGRGAVLELLTSLRDAYDQFDAEPIEFEQAAAGVRRWIDDHTFAPRTGDQGVHIVDVDSVRFGDFDHVQVAGLVEGEWPEPPGHDIFYPSALLRELGWPAETERVAGIRAVFDDLLHLPAKTLAVSTFTLEHDTLVAPSMLVDMVAAAGLPIVEREADGSVRVFEHEALGLVPAVTAHLDARARLAAEGRLLRRRDCRPGVTEAHRISTVSLSALERYQDCPFKYFAADVMKLEEPPVDQPMLSPRDRGRLVHEVFQRGFEAWDARGDGPIDVDRIDQARALFESASAPILGRLSEAEAEIERARLFGSAIAVGLVDVVLAIEAARPVEVRERLLEYTLEGVFSLGAPDRLAIPLKGVADRIDLLDGDRLRVIDYKSGQAPNPKRALQAPIYALCAQERLEQRDGRHRQIDEVSYVAPAAKRPLVPVVKPGGDAEALAGARARVADIVAGIERGAFPPRPYELRICGFCPYPSVCRKDYVGDE